jgi:hypothetical protein
MWVHVDLILVRFDSQLGPHKSCKKELKVGSKSGTKNDPKRGPKTRASKAFFHEKNEKMKKILVQN